MTADPHVRIAADAIAWSDEPPLAVLLSDPMVALIAAADGITVGEVSWVCRARLCRVKGGR